MIFNNIQTSLEDAKKAFDGYSWKKEAYGDLIEFVETVPFIRNMTSPMRPKISDLEKDEDGKIVIDVTNPPIFNDIDYFRQAALRYIKDGRYTDLYKNGNPNSEYMKFWNEEKRRCIDGYVRESDGMWITGYNYWYWNYNPIMLTKKHDDNTKKKKRNIGGVRAKRVYEHPEAWDGDIIFFHYVEQAEENAQHGIVAKARGRGFSFKAGSMLNRNMFLVKKSISYAFAAIEEYLTKDGILNKAWDTISFININTPFSKHFTPNTTMHKRAAYYNMEKQAYEGYLSEIMGVIVNKPDKARGKRCKLALWEEAGAFRNLDKAWNIFRKSVEDGSYVFGFSLGFGTGGSENQEDLESLERLFYSPDGYNIYSISNVFDKNVEGTKCGFFSPSYLNRKACYDQDGNSDIIKALIEIIKTRLTVKYGTSDSSALTQAKAEDPVTPVEAFLRTNDSVFPVSDIKDYLTDIIPKKEDFVSSHYVGDLHHAGEDKITWRLNSDIEVLRTYPIQEVDQRGGLEIYDRPKKGSDGDIPRGRYIIGLDPVDSDSGTSLSSAFVFDLWTDKIVAEFTGRRARANENFDLVLRTAMYYNAQINYENNLKGFYAFIENKHKLQYLMPTPSILKDQDMIKQSYSSGNKSYGTPANKAVNTWARKLLADWMLTPHISTVRENIVSADGKDEGKENLDTIKLRTIRSIGLLREASQWNPDGNFDRISAMGMVMIAREELYKYTENSKFSDNKQNNDILDNDEFLNNNAGQFAEIIL